MLLARDIRRQVIVAQPHDRAVAVGMQGHFDCARRRWQLGVAFETPREDDPRWRLDLDVLTVDEVTAGHGHAVQAAWPGIELGAGALPTALSARSRPSAFQARPNA